MSQQRGKNRYRQVPMPVIQKEVFFSFLQKYIKPLIVCYGWYLTRRLRAGNILNFEITTRFVSDGDKRSLKKTGIQGLHRVYANQNVIVVSIC